MDKITYLAELAEGLARWVPERERQDILRYYAEYFEEAGPDREAEVMAELGDPWALSCRLAVEGGYVTQEKAASWRPGKTWRRVLIGTAVGLTVFAMVAGTGLLFSITQAVSGYAWKTGVVTTDPEMVVDWGRPVSWGDFDRSAVDVVDIVGDTAFYYYTDDGMLESVSSIDVDIPLGNVEVVYGDDFTLSINYSDAMEAYAPTWEVTGGTLRLRDDSQWTRAEVNSWEDFKNLFGAGQQPVQVIITVPENAMLNEISVRTGLGDVLLWGVDAEAVKMETGMGDVECYHVRNVRWLGLSTGMGDVVLLLEEALDGLSVGLKTGMGDVEATLCGAEEDYSYALESGLSLVTVNGAVRGSSAEHRVNAPYRLDAASGTGSVNVYFN